MSDVLKRLFDLTVAGIGLLLFLPVLIVVAAIIKATTAGPILFRQSRVGRGERPFNILKFRTMTMAASTNGAQITVGADSRITQVGRFLRKYKLDELPQLINVIRGDMSLVGPRPETPRYVALYPADERREIFRVRPGITDNASIEFRNESDILGSVPDPLRYYIDVILPRKRAIYLQYVRHRSFVGDIVILWRTILVIFDRSESKHEQAVRR